MADITVFAQGPLTQIDAIVLDASIQELHTAEAEITEHPVEDGADPTDHYRLKSLTLQIEGLVTNTPIGPLQEARVTNAQGDNSIGYAEDAFKKLEAVREARKLITVVTSLKTYTNMAIQSLTVPRDRSTGDALKFTAILKQVRLVKNQTTTVTVKTTRARPKQVLGNKPATATSDATAAKATPKVNKSWALKGGEAIAKFAEGL